MSADSLLNEFVLSYDLPRCYQIGSFARRITLFSQQVRAFNLAWALLASGTVTNKDSVAVIGAGLAGLTVATALAIKGIQVILYERAAEVLHLQRGNRIRYLHPTIIDWPKESQYEYKLPYLNWFPGYSDEVAEQILRQWRLVEHLVTVKPFHDVKKVRRTTNNQLELLFSDNGDQQTHDLVVFCVGYGFERKLDGIPWRSYWQNDYLNQSVLIKQKRRFLICGCGDGGLTDALRLKIRDFDHGAFLVDVSRSYCDRIATDLCMIELFAERLRKSELGQGKSEIEVETLIRQFLQSEYERKNLPSAFTKHLTGLERKDTEVTINNHGPSYLSLNSAIINRIAIHALVKSNAIEYLPGSPSLARTNPDGSYLMRIQHGNDTVEREYDEVIVRQGVNATIDQFALSEELFRLRAAAYASEHDITRHVHFPSDFWKTEFSGMEDRLFAGEPALEYSAWFLVSEKLTSSFPDLELAHEFICKLVNGSGFELEKLPTDQLTDKDISRYSLRRGSDILDCSASTMPNADGITFDLAVCISSMSKVAIAAFLDREISRYSRFILVPRASILMNLFNAGASFADLSVNIVPFPRPNITIERRKGMFNAHNVATAIRCIDMLTDRFVNWQWFYDMVVNPTQDRGD